MLAVADIHKRKIRNVVRKTDLEIRIGLLEDEIMKQFYEKIAELVYIEVKDLWEPVKDVVIWASDEMCGIKSGR